jgi:hypothetical protein
VPVMKKASGIMHHHAASIPCSLHLPSTCMRHHSIHDNLLFFIIMAGTCGGQKKTPRNESIAYPPIKRAFDQVENTLWSFSGVDLPPILPQRCPVLCDLVLHFHGQPRDRRPLAVLESKSKSKCCVLISELLLPQLYHLHLLEEGACELSAYLAQRSPSLTKLRDIADTVMRLAVTSSNNVLPSPSLEKDDNQANAWSRIPRTTRRFGVRQHQQRG